MACFVVIGGVAAQLHGWPEATLDLDITVDPSDSNGHRLDRALVSVDAKNLMPGTIGTTMETRHGRLEIVSTPHGVRAYTEWASRAHRHVLRGGVAIAVADPQDILRSKQAAGRAKDRAVLGAMREVFAGEASDAPALPPLVSALLGPRPTPAGSAEIWQATAAQILEYQRRWSLDPVAPGLGPPADDLRQRADRRNLEKAIARARRLIERRSQK